VLYFRNVIAFISKELLGFGVIVAEAYSNVIGPIWYFRWSFRVINYQRSSSWAQSFFNLCIKAPVMRLAIIPVLRIILQPIIILIFPLNSPASFPSCLVTPTIRINQCSFPMKLSFMKISFINNSVPVLKRPPSLIPSIFYRALIRLTIP